MFITFAKTNTRALHPNQLSIKDFIYQLPEEKIAKFPLQERDASKLLFFNRDRKISDHRFPDLPDLLPENSFLVFNNTKVVQARLFFRKPTGGLIEVFCLEPVAPHQEVQLAMQQTGSCTWKCLVGNMKRWKEGALTLEFLSGGTQVILQAEKQGPCPDGFLIKFSWTPESIPFAEILAGAGNLPIPPYLNRETEDEDYNRYQTVYAQHQGAVAAPTAGLHFTDRVFNQLEKKNIQTAYLTLHVGAGTFKPVKAAQMQDHQMHAEQMVISRKFIQQLLQQLQHPVIPVGTTSMRCLESMYWLGVQVAENPEISAQNLHVDQWRAYEKKAMVEPKEALESLLQYMHDYNREELFASTQILIAPGYDFKICTGLITNFHQPESTLLLLVSALVGEDWKSIYKHALENNYRFLSYGDSSLLLKPH